MAETSAFSDDFESEVLNYYFRNQTLGFTRSPGPYLALVTAAVTETMTGSTITEATGTGYARQVVVFGAPAQVGGGAQIANTGALTFTAGASWGTITGIAICDASTAGKVLSFDNSMTDVAIGNGDSITFAVGGILVTLS